MKDIINIILITISIIIFGQIILVMGFGIVVKSWLAFIAGFWIYTFILVIVINNQ